MSIFNALWLRAALCIGAVCGVTPAGAAVEDFVGTWVNVGRNDAGITHVIVTRAGLGVNVEIYGDCQPRDCNQGNVRGTIYAPEPGADPLRSAIAVAATFTAGFSQKFIVLREARGNLMTLDLYTTFTDRARRASYTSRRGCGGGPRRLPASRAARRVTPSIGGANNTGAPTPTTTTSSTSSAANHPIQRASLRAL